MPKKILVTGGAGFIGHHFIEHILKNTDWEIVVVDRLDTSGNLNRLSDIECWQEQMHRVKFCWHDLKSEVNSLIRANIFHGWDGFDYIFHLAASSHVDRSITNPMEFVMDNVVGTTNLLLFAKEALRPGGKIFYFSTDEVFGCAPEGVAHKEWDRYNSRNPYAASKAGAEEIAVAFANTYKLPIIITHTMNAFGERQHPEKFIPMTIRAVRDGGTMTIHSNPEKTKAGSRFYIHCRNISAALLFLAENGKPLDGSGTVGKYNIVGEKEMDNLELAQFIAKVVGKPLKYEMVDFHSSRPGHDLRYALDGSLLKSMGFEYPKNFEESLEKTIRWYLDHPQWL